MTARGDGPESARIMVVGECWGDEEERRRAPFQGRSGEELNRMLHEVGVMRSECYVTNLVNERPPYGDMTRWMPVKKSAITRAHVGLRDRMVDPKVKAGFASLCDEIATVRPNIIVACGSSAMWALTGAWGVLKWRGSQLTTHGMPADYQGRRLDGIKVIPTIHPAAVLREYSLRPIVLNDLRRAARERETKDYSNAPDWKFVVRPNLPAVMEVLDKLQVLLDSAESDVWLDFDLETRAGHIACAGVSWSREDAICLPFMCVEDREGYWNAAEEAVIVFRLYKLLTHPRAAIRWQNGLYDAQYTYRHWHFVPRGRQDTMITHHTAWAGLPKSLAYQASMYCNHYVYWKDDGKTWVKDMSEEQLWRYNGIDCVRTREVGEESQAVITKLGLEGPDTFMQAMFWPVLQCMQRGVRVDKKEKARMATVLMNEMDAREQSINRIAGHQLNPRSNPQMVKFFYEDLQQTKIMSRAKKGELPHLTCNAEALDKIALREPILRPLVRKLAEYRTLGQYLSTFVMAPLDDDDRMRTSYNLCGTESFRLSSSENAFCSGGNLQNVPMGGEEDDSDLELPNVRGMYIPDHGYTMFDKDLSKADLRIVVWESGEDEMKAMLREGRDPYVEVAREFYAEPGLKKIRSDGSVNPKYRLFKSFCHGTHYLGTPTGLSGRLGLSVHQADKTQKWYLQKYHKIACWQDDFKKQVASRRYVENRFGFRRYYFDRIDDAIFREAIAWVPQSTVALYINHIWLALYRNYPKIQVLMQVHDSLVGQFPTHLKGPCMRDLEAASQIVIPYDDPLIIPTGTKTSERSWGDCE